MISTITHNGVTITTTVNVPDGSVYYVRVLAEPKFQQGDKVVFKTKSTRYTYTYGKTYVIKNPLNHSHQLAKVENDNGRDAWLGQDHFILEREWHDQQFNSKVEDLINGDE